MITRNASFPMLSTIANLLVIVGWLLVAAGSIAFLYGLVTMGHSGSSIIALISGLVAVILALLGIGAGELVGVAFAIEQNTRAMGAAGRASESNARSGYPLKAGQLGVGQVR